MVELDGPKRGVWIDFATGESGDVLALWASTHFTLPVDFSELLEDAGDWLMVPRIAAAPVLHTSRAYDDLGPTPANGITWRPMAACWPVSIGTTPQRQNSTAPGCAGAAMRMPEPRPLYNLPAIAAADAVVLVEGEKCPMP